MNWIIRLKYIRAIDEHGTRLPYKCRIRKDFATYEEYFKYYKEIESDVKKQFGKKCTIDVIKSEKI